MIVTLKKASLLAAGALARVNANSPTGSVSLSPFSDENPADVLAENVTVANTTLSATIDLVNAHYLIREQIGHANANGEIASLIGRRLVIDKMTGIVSKFPTRQTATLDVEAIIRQRESQRISAIPRAIELPLFDKPNHDDMLLQMKRERDEISEKLTELNFTTKITLSDGVVKILRDNHVI